MPEIAEAQALVAALEEMDEVKAEVARRRRKTRLHAAYGNAMILAHGYGARETSAALERARDTATAEDGFERLSAQYGLWAGSFVRGELGAMRELSAAMLRDCERRPQSGEASIAHRMRGVTHWCAGEFVAARGHLEKAIAIFDPERDGDLAFRFGQDPGIVATAYLAEVLWLLGEVELADQRKTETMARAVKSGHAATSAYGFLMAARFELYSTKSRSRCAFRQVAHQNRQRTSVAVLDGHFGLVRRLAGMAVGRPQARSCGDAQQLGAPSRTGQRHRRSSRPYWLRPKLKPARVTWLFARSITGSPRQSEPGCIGTTPKPIASAARSFWGNSADTLTAEEAFQRAIAVAGEQGARSFDLRAALSLAKLYQSTGRPAEAHAVLAPALEGFSPTPEMPEIAEAQALLVAIEAGAHVRDE